MANLGGAVYLEDTEKFVEVDAVPELGHHR